MNKLGNWLLYMPNLGPWPDSQTDAPLILIGQVLTVEYNRCILGTNSWHDAKCSRLILLCTNYKIKVHKILCRTARTLYNKKDAFATDFNDHSLQNTVVEK